MGGGGVGDDGRVPPSAAQEGAETRPLRVGPRAVRCKAVHHIGPISSK